MAAIISIADLDRLERLDARREQDFAILDEIGRALKDVPPDELEREVEHALADVRAEMRVEQLRRDTRPAAS